MSNYTKKILQILSKKPAISVEDLVLGVPSTIEGKNSKSKYALTRAVKNLAETGFVDIIDSGHQSYAKLTPKGKNKLNSMKLMGDEALVSATWDGFWRIIILDLPEERKAERESLRYLLKKANFVCIKNTVWISPHPYENLFANIKKDLSLTTELMILVTDKLDPETHLAFLEAIKK